MSAHRSVINGLLIGLCACVLMGQRADAVYSMAETCKLFPEGYIADPNNCQGWGYCKGGVLAGTGKCSDGLRYDSRSAQCNYADTVQCITSKVDMCQGLNAIFKADPDDCSNYCYCNNGKTECNQCPPEQVFNPELNSCVWAVNYPQCPANSPCRLMPNNRFVQNPSDCNGYLRCVEGSGIPGKCTSPYVFNPSNGLCDTFSTADCSNSSGESDNVQKPPDVVAICKRFETSGEKTQFFSDGQTCEGYVACDSASNGNWQKCPFGTHFNPAVGKCVTPYSYACSYNRCANLDLPFVTAYNTECGEYISCKNQQSVPPSQSCKAVNPEFSYFEENLGGCVQTKPNQEICNPVQPAVVPKIK